MPPKELKHPGMLGQLLHKESSKMPPMKVASHKGWLWMQKAERDDEGNLWEQSYFALVEKTLRMYRTDEEAESHLKDVRFLAKISHVTTHCALLSAERCTKTATEG
jgi:hypothetical protein